MGCRTLPHCKQQQPVKAACEKKSTRDRFPYSAVSETGQRKIENSHCGQEENFQTHRPMPIPHPRIDGLQGHICEAGHQQ